jgi:hypothetical protein
MDIGGCVFRQKSGRDVEVNPSSGEVKNGWSCTSTPPCTDTGLPLPYLCMSDLPTVAESEHCTVYGLGGLLVLLFHSCLFIALAYRSWLLYSPSFLSNVL